MNEANLAATPRPAARLNSFHLKTIACLTMLIDHIGAIFFPTVYVLRIIGRLAFPIFAWMITNGYQHTSNRVKYFTRLSLFALISQLPFSLAFHRDLFGNLNIFFTLAMGLGAIHCYEIIEARQWKAAAVLGIAFAAELLNTDYGLYGVVTIVLFWIYRQDFSSLVRMQVFINAAMALPAILVAVTGDWSALLGAMQAVSLLSLLLIRQYNSELGPKVKYAFYAFYPGHLLVLHLIERTLR